MRITKEVTAPTLPFTIVRCSNETAPYHFAGISSDSGDRCNGLPWIVPVITKPLYLTHRLPIQLDLKREPILKGMADYSIEGLTDHIAIERKSVSDLYSTIGGRRYDFKCEIARLNMLPFSAVVIEGDWSRILLDPPAQSQMEPKNIARTILSWSIRFPRVHWFTCSDRRHAELLTFQLLRQFWKQHYEKQ
ncbi:MAG TPA: ERCC4 domain-containing protein [Planctomicrobium sp.]|nr:ERCC4 domain-containing protein [Planctomicrobium sp.]